MSAAGYMQALQIAGGVIESIAASRAAQEMRDETAREIRRQGKYRNQGFSELGQVIPTQGVESARQSISENAGKRTEKYASANEQKFDTSGNGPTDRDKVAIGMSGAARANLGAYSDWQLNQMIKRIRLQEKLNKISSFSGGEAQIFPSRLSDAQHSQDELGAFGAFLGSVGGAGSSYAAYARQNPSVASDYSKGYDYTPQQGGQINTNGNDGQTMWS